MASSDSGMSERVVADNGRQETIWLVTSILLILIFASVTLTYNQQASGGKVHHLELDVTGKAVLTALRNAADEITFMADGGELPSIEDLQGSALPPFTDDTGAFSGYRWQKPEANCYYGQSENSPAFVLKFTTQPQIFWHSAGLTSLEDCSQLTHWHTASVHD